MSNLFSTGMKIHAVTYPQERSNLIKSIKKNDKGFKGFVTITENKIEQIEQNGARRLMYEDTEQGGCLRTWYNVEPNTKKITYYICNE